MRTWLILLAALGCSSGVHIAGGATAGVSLGDAGLAACDHYYAAQLTRCGGPQLPAAEAARQLSRFEQVCQNEAVLPGSGISAATLEACAEALDLSPCELPAGPPEGCLFYGTLPGGSPCADGIQCQGGYCAGTQNYSPEGPIAPATCGTCDDVSSVGQLCGQAGCPAGSICLTDDPSMSPATVHCHAMSFGTQGTSCNDLDTYCQPGLYCSSGSCQPLAQLGQHCGDMGDPGGCAAPASCDDPASACENCSDVASVCESTSDGGSCQGDFDCAPGLGCLPSGPCSDNQVVGCASSGACLPIAWAAPGQPCSLAVRCLVGSCFDENPPVSTQADDGGLLWSSCPTVIADGQSCTTRSTCDAFAECFEGACILTDAVSCQ